MPEFEVLGVSDIPDKQRVPFIVVRKRLPQCKEKFILKAGDGVCYKVNFTVPAIKNGKKSNFRIFCVTVEMMVTSLWLVREELSISKVRRR